jgi:hypothetical protein
VLGARVRVATLLAFLVSATLLAVQPATTLGPAERIADGVELYRLDDPSLLTPAGPVSVQALRLDPGKVRIEMGVAEDRLPARETVQGIATRNGALAAVNAGFFALANGAPAGFLKRRGKVEGRARRPRGAVAFTERFGKIRPLFDRVSVVLSPKEKIEYQPRLGTSAKDWARAPSAVGGAGLLRLEGRDLTEWADEQLSAGFDTTRHPRTLIGVDAQDAIWLVTIDGRQPTLSLGMSFTELQGLSRRLGLKSSLNLDGGGSTTMVVRGNVVNHPSDPAGPRPVSDAILVFVRKR